MKNKNDAVEELLPCPFCGSSGVLHYDKLDHYWVVSCIVPLCGQIGCGFSDDMEAIKTWNTRKPTQCKSDDGKCGCGFSEQEIYDTIIDCGHTQGYFQNGKVGQTIVFVSDESDRKLANKIFELLKSKGW